MPRLAPALALSLLLAPGCQQSLPAGPSELSTGITVYEHANFQGESAHITADTSNLSDFKGPCEHSDTDANFQGESAHITADTSNLSDFKGPCEHSDTDANGVSSSSYDWNDCISSVRIAPGWRATIYRGSGYHDIGRAS